MSGLFYVLQKSFCKIVPRMVGFYTNAAWGHKKSQNLH